MESTNYVSLVGTIGRASTTPTSGGSVTHMSVVTEYFYKNREGEACCEATWHNVVAWNLPQEDIARLTKGAAVRLEGRMSHRRYTAEDGSERSVSEIVVSKISFPDLGSGQAVRYENYIEIAGTVSRLSVQQCGGKRVARYAVVTGRRGKDAAGKETVYNTWHNVVTWETPGFDFDGIREGAAILVDGRIRVRKYVDASGNDRTATEVYSSGLRFFDSITVA